MSLIRNAMMLGLVGATLWHFAGPLFHQNKYGSNREYPSRHAYAARRESPVYTARPVRLPAGDAIYFAPSDNLERIDIELIDIARSSISVAMYAFTDRNLAAALVSAAHRGVQVRVYRDKVQYNEERERHSPALPTLLGESAIQVRVKRSEDLMHEKAMLIDGSTLRDGSGNWSISASRYQDNQVSITHDPEQIAQFRRNFEAMWSRHDNTIVR